MGAVVNSPKLSGMVATGNFAMIYSMKNVKFKAQMAFLPLAISAIAATGSAQAQNQLKETVVTASRLEQQQRDALSATTVLTRSDIDRAQVSDLPGLLKNVTGMEWTQSGGAGTVSSAFIRGAESRHTLILVDGMPVNNLNFGTAAPEHIPLSNIERIEIVRGNVSSLYGSAAIGGVIQIFTREAGDKPYGAVTVQAGSRNYSQIQAGAGVKLGAGTRISFTTDSLKDDGFNAIDQAKIAGTNPDLDGYRRQSWSLGLSQDIGIGKVNLTARESSGVTAYDSNFGPATQADESKFRLAGMALAGSFKLGSQVELDAGLAQQKDQLRADLTAFPYFVNSSTDTSSLGLRWQVAAGHRLSAGIEQTQQRIESNTAYTRSARTQDSTRLGYVGSFDRHQVQANVRQDSYSDFGTASTWLAGYGYQVTDALRVAAQVSTGFNAPTFNDLYNPFGGNTALRPEKVDSREFSVQYATDSTETRLVVFSNQFVDLIANDAFFNRANIASARNDGAELSFRGKWGATQVSGGLTAQNPQNLVNNTRLLRRAMSLANLGVDHELGDVSVGARWRYVGDRIDGVNTLAAYSVLDLTAAYRFNKEWKLLGRIDNLFDARYETVYGYRQAGLGAFVGVTWQPVP